MVALDALFAAANVRSSENDPKALLERLRAGRPQREEASAAAPWKYRANATIMYWIDSCVPEAGAESQDVDSPVLNVALLDTGASSARIVARSEPITIQLSGEDQICSQCEAQPLDFAPYAIRDTETAFGVRVFRAQRSAESSRNIETLYLFRVNGAVLDEILEVETLRDQVLSRERSESTQTRRVVVMQRKAHDGFFDIVVRSVTDRSEPATNFHWSVAAGAYRRQQ
jgi:hypothetical protein